jgi:hypothetical protein
MSDTLPHAPQYMSYLNPNMMDSYFNSLQHQSIDKNVTDSAKDVTREVSAVDKHLSDGIFGVSSNVAFANRDIVREVSAVDKHLGNGICNISEKLASGNSDIRDALNTNALGLRDAIERDATNISNNLTNLGASSADRDRDIQVTVERTANNGSQVTERNANLLLQSIERNAGESRYANAISDAANRQASNDLARDIINQTNRNSNQIDLNVNRIGYEMVNATNKNTNDLLTAVERNGSSNAIATTSSGYETRTLLINANNSIQEAICKKGAEASEHYASLLLEQHKNKECLSAQAANYYASTLLEQQKIASAQLLEQHKIKECLTLQNADAKYEALKNTERLSAQLYASSCENKYEALKNTQALSTQMAECCCELKMKVGDVSVKMEDTLRSLDNQRVRDALNAANSEINMLKYMNCRGRDNDYGCDRGGNRVYYYNNDGRGRGGNDRPSSPH